MELKWKSQYNIGNFKIDVEHKKLFLLANKAISLSHKGEDLKNLIKELYEYTTTHFQNEERYMYMIEYPDLARHRRLHQEILIRLNEVVIQFKTLNLEEVQAYLQEFIQVYLIDHIIEEDKRIEYFKLSLEDLRKHFGWKKAYEIGHQQIDEEHKNLFDIAAQAFEDVEPSQRAKKVKAVIIKLNEYMKTHFKNEEKLMEELAYPELEAHKKLHAYIISKMLNFIKTSSSMSLDIFEKELAQIIDIVLLQHIIQEDSKVSRYIKQKKRSL